MDVHQTYLWLPFMTLRCRWVLAIYKVDHRCSRCCQLVHLPVTPSKCWSRSSTLRSYHSLMRIAIETRPSPDTGLVSPSDSAQASPDSVSPLSLFPAISYSLGHSLGILHRLRLTPLRPVTQTSTNTFSISNPGDPNSPCSPQQQDIITMPTPSPSSSSSPRSRSRSTKGILFQPPTEEQHRDMIRLGFMSLPSSF